MKYINMDDLTTIIQNRLLIESIEKEEEILAGIDGILVKLRDGIMTLPQDIPPVTDEDGNVQYPILYGHTRNGGWFL